MSGFLINPFAFAAAGGDFESIATVTVGSGGASSIEFTSIPSTYQHLQVRAIGRHTGSSANGGSAETTFNGDTGTNYTYHALLGDGSSAAAAALTGERSNYTIRLTTATQSADSFGVGIFNILDYANTSKYKVLRNFAGWENNGSGRVYVDSGLWLSTSAITSIKLAPNTGNFAEHTTAALFGVKA